MANIALITNNVLSDSGTALTSVVTGSGTTNYLSKFTGSTALGNSLIYDDGTNIGIGTASPSYKLDVNGTFRVQGNSSIIATSSGVSSSANAYIYDSTTNYLVLTKRGSSEIGNMGLPAGSVEIGNYNNGALGIWTSSNYIALGSNSSEKMRLNISTGNLLIGTTTDAGYKLDVNGTGRFQDILTVTTGTTKGINFAGTKIVEPTNATTYTQLLIQPNSGDKAAVFQFAPSGTSTASVMEFYSSSALTISSRFIFKNNSGILQIGGDAASLPITFISNNVETARFSTAGNFLIGTTTDTGYKLDVNGVIRAGSASSVSGSNILWGNYGNGALTTLGSMYSDGGPVLGYAVSPSTSGSPAFLSSTGITIARGAYAISGATHYWFGGSSQTVAIGSSVSMSEFMRIASTGNLLVGTSTDSGYKLDINGTARIAGVATFNNNINQTSGTASFANGILLDSTRRIFGANTITYQSNDAASQHYFKNDISNGLSGTLVTITNGSGTFGTTSASNFLNISGRLAAASGTNNLTSILLNHSVENTGTYTGIIRGIYYNVGSPVGTGYTHRAIETTVGDVIFNSTSGSVGIGTTSPAYKLQVAGDIGFTAGANRYIRMANPSSSGSANHIVIQAASANTSGTGGNIYLYEGSGAGGPGPGSIYIGATTGWTTAYVTGRLTVTNSGPNTETAFQVNAGGQNGLTIYWDNLTPYMGYGLVVNRQSRFYNSSSYSFDNNLIIGSNTNAGYKLDVNGTARVQGVITGSVSGGSLSLGAASSNSQAITITGYFTGNGAISTANSNGRSFNTNIGGQGYGFVTSYNGLAQGQTTTNIYFSATGNINLTDGAIDLHGFNFNPTIVSETGATIKAFSSGLNSASNHYNLYLSGTAQNYIAGNVGIGTTSPTEKLSVNGNMAFPKSGNTFIYNDQSGADSITIGGASYFSVKTYNGANYTEVFRATATNNLLIGTTTDAGYKLQVNGTGYVSSTLQVGVGGYNGFTLQVEGSATFGDTVVQNRPLNGNALGGITSYQSQSNLTYNFGNGTYSGETISGELANSVQVGQVVAMRASTLQWELADASTSASIGKNMIGIACENGGAGNTITILLCGFFASNTYYNNSGNYGVPMYLNASTSGSLTDVAPSTTGNIVRIVGHIDNYNNANSCTVIRFNPDNSWLVI